MLRHLTIRAAGIAAFITLSGTAAAAFPGCDGSDAFHARDLHGNWSLDDGEANVSGSPVKNSFLSGEV